MTIKTETCSPHRDQEYGQPWYVPELWFDVTPSLHLPPSLKVLLRNILELLEVIKALPCEVCLGVIDRGDHLLMCTYSS